MGYKIINNIVETENHFTRIRELLKESDTILVASPFLMGDVSAFFNKVDFSRLKNIHLITTLPLKSIVQFDNAESLISLIELPSINEKKINCRISINNRLHGKVYIFKESEQYISAIISSANFTEPGLALKHEWGVEIFDKDVIKELEQSICDTVEVPNISFEEICSIQNKSENLPEPLQKLKNPKIEISLLNVITERRMTSSPLLPLSIVISNGHENCINTPFGNIILHNEKGHSEINFIDRYNNSLIRKNYDYNHIVTDTINAEIYNQIEKRLRKDHPNYIAYPSGRHYRETAWGFGRSYRKKGQRGLSEYLRSLFWIHFTGHEPKKMQLDIHEGYLSYFDGSNIPQVEATNFRTWKETGRFLIIKDYLNENTIDEIMDIIEVV